MRTVAPCLITDGNKNETAALHLQDFPLADSELRWIHLIVSRVDRVQRSLDLSEQWLRIIKPGSLVRVNHVIGILTRDPVRHRLVNHFVGAFTRRILLL